MTEYPAHLSGFFIRDLSKLKEELNAYTTEANIWKVVPHISNSAGTLTLHLLGNLNHFIGHGLGHTAYVRDRDAEFAIRDVPRAVLIADIDRTIEMIGAVMGRLTNEDFDKVFPIQKPEATDSTGRVLIGFFGHLDYHLGQINYHRRLLDMPQAQ